MPLVQWLVPVHILLLEIKRGICSYQPMYDGKCQYKAAILRTSVQGRRLKRKQRPGPAASRAVGIGRCSFKFGLSHLGQPQKVKTKTQVIA